MIHYIASFRKQYLYNYWMQCFISFPLIRSFLHYLLNLYPFFYSPRGYIRKKAY
jgi:hypothetical protein